jgi:hypothetical protein
MSPSHGPSNSLEQLLLQSLQHLLIALQLNQAPPLSNLPQRMHSLHKPRRVGLWRCFWYPLGFDTPRPLYLRIRSSLTLGRIQHFCFQAKIAGRRRPRAWSYQSRTRIIRDCSHTRDPHRAPLLSLCPRQHYTRMTLSTTTSGLVVHLSPIASFSSAARSTSVVSLFCINHLHLCTHARNDPETTTAAPEAFPTIMLAKARNQYAPLDIPWSLSAPLPPFSVSGFRNAYCGKADPRALPFAPHRCGSARARGSHFHWHWQGHTHLRDTHRKDFGSVVPLSNRFPHNEALQSTA